MKSSRKKAAKLAELGHERVFKIGSLDVSPENTSIYKPITEGDPATIRLRELIEKYGLIEPLIVSADDPPFIISGHRRYLASQMAGLLEVPCRVLLNVRRGEGKEASNEYLKLLAACNAQRIKSRDEILREEIVNVDPEKAFEPLMAQRKRKSKLKVEAIELREVPARCKISPAKFPFIEAIRKVIRTLEDILPLTIRQIFYQLLKDPPLKHASKPDSRFRGDKASYSSLIDLATRARHEGLIDYEAIHDPTRIDVVWDTHPNLASYYRAKLDDLLADYRRDYMQSQPNFIQIIVEKNTQETIIRPVAEEYTTPYQIGRGQDTTTPLYDIQKRFKESGKEKLIILALGDLDPDGDAIVHSIGQRLRDDYEIPEDKVRVIKVVLTMKQVKELNLPEWVEPAKVDSPSYQRYVEKYGTDKIWELEALDPEVEQDILREYINNVIDIRAFNHEVKQEREDAVHLAAVREIVLRTLREQINP